MQSDASSRKAPATEGDGGGELDDEKTCSGD